MNKKDFYKINDLLKKWNPLNLPEFIANTEYIGYISKITSNCDSIRDIEKSILDVLKEDLTLTIQQDDTKFKEEILKLAINVKEIIELDSSDL